MSNDTASGSNKVLHHKESSDYGRQEAPPNTTNDMDPEHFMPWMRTDVSREPQYAEHDLSLTSGRSQPIPQSTHDSTNDTRSTVPESFFRSTAKSRSTQITQPFTAATTEMSKFSANDQVISNVEEESLTLARGTEEYDDIYSDAGSIADHEEIYATVLRNELFQDLEPIDLAGAERNVSQLLEEFAIRIGHQGESREHQNLMYVVHKNRR